MKVKQHCEISFNIVCILLSADSFIAEGVFHPLCYFYRIPSSDPSGLTVVLKPVNYERVQRAARVRTRQEIEAAYEITKREKEEAMVGNQGCLDIPIAVGNVVRNPPG